MNNSHMDPADLTKFKEFITLCTASPQIINLPQFSFFKDFIVNQCRGKVPSDEFQCPPSDNMGQEDKKETFENIADPKLDDESEPESDLELDMNGVIEGDTEPPQDMGDPNKVPTEEEIDEASDYRTKAAGAYADQKYDEAIQLYTKAIEINPTNALFHAKRGQSYIKLKKPNACIRDCDRALEINSDCAAAYKYRGRAHRLLGNWEKAVNDLRQACKLDFDEEADEWLREVTPNAKRIEQHKIKQERKNAEREQRKKEERYRQAQEANRRAAEENKKSASSGARGGGGDGGGSGGIPNLGNLFNNMSKDDLDALNDPEILVALQDIMSNPINITKYQSTTKIMNLISKLGSAMGGATGGGFPPGAGGFPGANKPTPPPPNFNDDGLD